MGKADLDRALGFYFLRQYKTAITLKKERTLPLE